MNQDYTPAQQAIYNAAREAVERNLTARFQLEGIHQLPQVRSSLQQIAKTLTWLADSNSGFDLRCLDLHSTEALEDILDALAEIRLRISEPRRIRLRNEAPPVVSHGQEGAPVGNSKTEGGTPGFGAASIPRRAHPHDCQDFRLSDSEIQAGHDFSGGPEKLGGPEKSDRS